jgi:hypothetical protein
MISKEFLDEGMEHVRERGTYNQMRSLMSNPTLLYSKYWSTMRKNVKYNYREQINNVHKCKLRPGTFITGDVHLLQLLCLYYRCDAFITGAVLLLQVRCLYYMCCGTSVFFSAVCIFGVLIVLILPFKIVLLYFIRVVPSFQNLFRLGYVLS